MPAHFGRDTRDYVTDYIKFADAKAGALLTLSVGVAGAIGATMDHSLALLPHASKPFTTIGLLFFVIFAVATLMILWHAVHAIGPRTPNAAHSLASFPDIAAMESTEYESACRTVDGSKAAVEYAKVNHALSTVAKEKFAAIGDAVWWFRVHLLSAYVLFLWFAVLCVLSPT